MEVLCARCLHPASEDERQCPYCRDDLFDRPVVLVDTDDGRASRYQGRAHTSVAFASIGLAVWRAGTRRPDRDGDAGPAQGAAADEAPDPAVVVRPLTSRDERVAAQTLVISRLIGLAPAVTEAALDGWWQARSPRVVVQAGPDRVELGPPVHRRDGEVTCRLTCDLHRRSRWRCLHLELEVTPWSSSRTELHLRPLRRLHSTDRYFDAGQAVLDRIAAELTEFARGCAEAPSPEPAAGPGRRGDGAGAVTAAAAGTPAPKNGKATIAARPRPPV